MAERETPPSSSVDADNLPEDFSIALHQLGVGEWRERKAAAERILIGARERWGDDPPRVFVEALIEAVLDPDRVDGRAGAHEVLVELGSVVADVVRERLDAEPDRMNVLIDVLGEVGDQSDLPRLENLALDAGTDENLRAAAVSAMATTGGERATPALLRLLDDPSSMLQLYVLDALRESEATVPVQRLAELLEASVSRKAAVELLGYASTEEAIPMLVPRLDDPMPSVRSAAVRALHQLHRSMAETSNAGVVSNALGGLSATLRGRVREQIRSRTPAVAAAAVDLAAMSGDVEALREMLPAMTSVLVFERALEFVARSGGRANGVLLSLTETAEPSQREALFRLIGSMPPEALDPRLIAPLTAALEQPNEALAVAACDTLERVGGRQAMAALYRCCSHEGQLGEHAGDALAAIAERLGGTGRDDLVLIVGGSWPHRGPLARNLCRVVGRLGLVDFVPPLVTMLGSADVGVRVAAALALGQINGEHEGVAALCFSLADEEPQVRAAACRSLGLLSAERSVHALLSATADPSALVRAAAVQALVSIGNSVAMPKLRDLIHDDPSPTVIVHAIAALALSRSEQDLALLMSLCTSEDHEVVKAAARALSGYRAHRATAALLGLLSHTRWDVRWAAAEVLEHRGDPTALHSLRGALEVERDGLVAEVLERAIAELSAAAEASKPDVDDGRGGGSAS